MINISNISHIESLCIKYFMQFIKLFKKKMDTQENCQKYAYK